VTPSTEPTMSETSTEPTMSEMEPEDSGTPPQRSVDPSLGGQQNMSVDPSLRQSLPETDSLTEPNMSIMASPTPTSGHTNYLDASTRGWDRPDTEPAAEQPPDISTDTSAGQTSHDMSVDPSVEQQSDASGDPYGWQEPDTSEDPYAWQEPDSSADVSTDYSDYSDYSEAEGDLDSDLPLGQ
jgi:hypothetical protein